MFRIEQESQTTEIQHGQTNKQEVFIHRVSKNKQNQINEQIFKV